MKRTKIFYLLILFFLLVVTGCGKNVTTGIEVSKEPLQVYTTTDKLDDILKDIKIKVIAGKKTYLKDVTDEDVKITGFDLTKPGYHTMKIMFDGKELEWTYLVKVPAWNKEALTNWYKESDTTIKITTPEQLAGLAKLVNQGNTFKGKTILLENDIDLNNNPWTPIGSLAKGSTGVASVVFEGTFDGQNHTIENLSIMATHKTEGEHILSDESYYNCGLFGHVMNATLKNINIKNVKITNGMMNNNVRSTQGTGSLVGWANGTSIITNIKVSGNIMINGEYKVGGAIGNLSGTNLTISNISVIGDATSLIYGSDKKYGDTNNFGGIIGFSDATDYTIANCVSDITVSGYTSGGIIGCSSQPITIINCAVYGETKDPEGSITGGITGARFATLTVKNCYVLGKVSFGDLDENKYADVIVGKYGTDKTITSENIYYASDKNDEKVFNSLEAVSKTYSEILAMLPEDLKIK